MRDKDNKTPVHYASEGGEKDILVYLIEELDCDIGEFNYAHVTVVSL